jgi:hypothetical protein
MSLDQATVEAYLRQGERNVQKLEENVWIVGIRGPNKDFNVLVRLANKWLYMGVPFPKKPELQYLAKLYPYLLTENFRMNMAKFCVGEEKEILLTVELPTSDLQLSEFEAALNLLCGYADGLYEKVESAASGSNPELLSDEHTNA